MVRTMPTNVHHGVTSASKPNRTNDNMILHIAFYLSGKDDYCAMQVEIERHFHRMDWSTNYNDVRDTLVEMQSEKWITCQQYGKKPDFIH